MTLLPFAASSGPQDAKIAIVGEAWTHEEEKEKKPLLGEAGKELTRMLSQVGIEREECFLTDVLALRPWRNDLKHVTGLRAEVGQESASFGPLGNRRFLKDEHLGELDRLRRELEIVQPKVIIALGATACWALLGSAEIGKLRGYAAESPWGLVVPTWHPSSILKDWSLRPVGIMDLKKAKRIQEKGYWRPHRQLLVGAELDELEEWFSRPTSRYAVDIETYGKQITMVGFARSSGEAAVVPFVGRGFRWPHWWPSEVEELQAWKLVKRILEGPSEKIFHNGMYDLQYLWRAGIRPMNCLHDSMLLHHAMYPELKKGLGFLGSLYTDETSWKLMRERKEEGDGEKSDD